MQESNSFRHQAVEAQQSSSQEVVILQQQLSDLPAQVLQPLQAEHGAMLAALSMVTQLATEPAPAEPPQPADRGHLMEPALHVTREITGLDSPTGSAHSPSADSPSDAPRTALGRPVGARETAEAAVRAVQQCLSQAQEERAALLEAQRLAEVGCKSGLPPSSAAVPVDGT